MPELCRHVVIGFVLRAVVLVESGGVPRTARRIETTQAGSSPSAKDLLLTGRLRAGSCDHVGETDCTTKLGCAWSGGRCHLRVAWLHVMKTGGSFGTTLAHYANVSLPCTAHMPSGLNQSDPEDRTTEGSQGEDNFFKYKYPIKDWFHGVFAHPYNPGNHVPISDAGYANWKGKLFGIFRQPEHRALSAWHHFGKDKGLDLASYARKIHGQQASMLSLGKRGWAKIRCEFGDYKFGDSCSRMLEPDVPLAIKRLDGFAFVGLLEEYDLSVCLFHRMFGGQCLPVEFVNMRPGQHRQDPNAKEVKMRELSVLKAQKDPWDGPLYEAALRRFWSDVKKYDARPSTCLQTCPNAAHIFSPNEGAGAGAANSNNSPRANKFLAKTATSGALSRDQGADGDK